VKKIILISDRFSGLFAQNQQETQKTKRQTNLSEKMPYLDDVALKITIFKKFQNSE
jgi:hypothetical protein